MVSVPVACLRRGQSIHAQRLFTAQPPKIGKKLPPLMTKKMEVKRKDTNSVDQEQTWCEN